MAIAFVCACGKKYSVPDTVAGKRTQCKSCGAAVTVPTLPVEADFETVDDDDFDLVEDEPIVPLPAKQTNVFAELNKEDAKPRKRDKSKKKAKSKPSHVGMTREEEREFLNQVTATWARRMMVIRSSAYLIMGTIIVVGVGVLFAFWKSFFAFDGILTMWLTFGLIFAGCLGVAAIGKGIIGLLTGQVDDE